MGVDEFNKKGEDLESFYNAEIDEKRAVEEAIRNKEEQEQLRIEKMKQDAYNKQLRKKLLFYFIIFIIISVIVTGIVYLIMNLKIGGIDESHKKILAFDSGHFANLRQTNFSKFFLTLNNNGFNIKMLDSEITSEKLSGVDSLIIPVHTSYYLASEREAVKKFSKDGGKIVILGDFNNEEDLDIIMTEVLGIPVNFYYCYSDWDAFTIGNHSIIKGVERLKLPASDCINISNESGFVPIISAVPSNIPGVDLNSELPVAYIRDSPNKFLILGDSNLCDNDYIDWGQNRVFCNNIGKWLY